MQRCQSHLLLISLYVMLNVPIWDKITWKDYSNQASIRAKKLIGNLKLNFKKQFL